MKTFVINLEKCNGCYACQLACKDETVGNQWLPYSEPQPKTGHFWLRMTEKVHGQVPKVRVEYRPEMCRHCEEAPCMEAVPEAVYRRPDGLVIVDPEKARGQRQLVDTCPYGAIWWNDELEIPQKCTGCAHLVDDGKLPHCVDACPTDALLFGEEEELTAMVAQDQGAFAIDGTKPRVHYVNPFGLFISGEVWDPKADLIIEGATVTLEGPDGTAQVAATDGFGDFWFRHLDVGTYRMFIEADGFQGVQKTIELTESVNIGDFPLQKA